jgi:hypothetical protein
MQRIGKPIPRSEGGPRRKTAPPLPLVTGKDSVKNRRGSNKQQPFRLQVKPEANNVNVLKM